MLETVKNKSVDYEYNELNQLVKKTTSTNDTYTYSYDKPENPGTEDKDDKKANGKPALLFQDAAETIVCGRAFRFVQRSDHIL